MDRVVVVVVGHLGGDLRDQFWSSCELGQLHDAVPVFPCEAVAVHEGHHI